MILPKKSTILILKNVIILAFSVIFAFIFNYNITIELVRRFIFISEKLRIPLGILMLIFQVFIFFAIIKLVLAKNIDSLTSKILWICYFFMMLFLLFGRPVATASINLNPLDIFHSLNNSDGILVSLFNIIFFTPIGILFVRKKAIHILAIMVPVGFVTELIQYLFKLGIFDINDIILNTLGVYIGFLILKNLNKLKKLSSEHTTINK